jgi:hypothetical protein
VGRNSLKRKEKVKSLSIVCLSCHVELLSAVFSLLLSPRFLSSSLVVEAPRRACQRSVVSVITTRAPVIAGGSSATKFQAHNNFFTYGNFGLPMSFLSIAVDQPPTLVRSIVRIRHHHAPLPCMYVSPLARCEERKLSVFINALTFLLYISYADLFL